MTAFLSPIAGGGFQAFDNQGAVLAGGLLYTYFAGSTAAQATWTNSLQTITNANPVVLDSAGRSTNELWLQGGQSYKFVLKDSLGNTLATWDNVPGLNDASYAAFSEWVVYGSAPTYVNATTFTVSGNAAALLQVGRRIQFFILTGTFYGTIASSTFNSGPGTTSVVLTLDSTSLDNTLYAFAYSFLSSTNSSIPIGVFAPLASPVFTGHPTAPTQTPLSNDTQLATDAYVDLAVAVEKARALAAEILLAPLASPTFTGDPKAPTASPGDTDTSIANTAFVAAAVLVETNRATTAEALLAPLASPALTGNPTAPTQTAGNNSTRLATTAFVTASAFSSALPSQTGNSGKFVTTDGVNASWALPVADQTGNSGKFLTTDGTNTSWAYATPIGAVLSWPTETVPTGFLECDGSSLLRAGTYAALFAVLGTIYGTADGTHFNLPDYRGRFLRTWAHGSSNDPDRASRTAVVATGSTMTAGDHVGTQQVDGFKAHTHSQNATPSGGLFGNGTAGDGTSPQTGSTGGNETRPINVYVMQVIRF